MFSFRTSIFILMASVIVMFVVGCESVTPIVTEYATFESFYKESSAVGWVIGAIFAIFAAAAIFFTGGTASPIVATIGAWIGGTMGLTGIAATNAGLALLGGGSIAAGGFGILGGTAVLTAALSFSTDVVIDYTVGKAISEYQYRDLAKTSKKMPTLPLPKNDSGPDSYKKAIEILEDIDISMPVSGNSNQLIIMKAIETVEGDTEILDDDEESKKESLLSLLYFVSNHYRKANEHASIAINKARSSDIRRTLPAYIFATSSLYGKRFDFQEITNNYFGYSILAEPDNPMIPLLFSIYLDRMMLRFNDNYLDEKAFRQIFMIMKSPSIEDKRLQNYTILMSRYFIRLKLEQQKISSLTNTANRTIKDSPETLKVVKDSLVHYSNLTNDAEEVMQEILSLNDDLDIEDKKRITEFHSLLIKYIKDKDRLESMAKLLNDHQKSLGISVVSDEKSDDKNTYIFLVLLILSVVGAGTYFLVKKQHAQKNQR